MAKQESIGALWNKRGTKGEYMDGVIGGKPVVVFRNDYKQGNQPDWRIFPKIKRDELPPRDEPPIKAEEVPF